MERVLVMCKLGFGGLRAVLAAILGLPVGQLGGDGGAVPLEAQDGRHARRTSGSGTALGQKITMFAAQAPDRHALHSKVAPPWNRLATGEGL